MARTRLASESEKEDELSGLHCNGRFVWRIRELSSFLDKMRGCTSFVLYSKE
jgi:hypothetical protein